MSDRRIVVEIVGDSSRIARVEKSLREKLEGPAAMRELIASAREVLSYEHHPSRASLSKLREALDRFDEIRTGAAPLAVGDRVQVKPDFDIPSAFRGGNPSEGVIDDIHDDLVIVIVDGKSVPYPPNALERVPS